MKFQPLPINPHNNIRIVCTCCAKLTPDTKLFTVKEKPWEFFCYDCVQVLAAESLREKLSQPDTMEVFKRLKDFYEIGPVQRAAVEDLVEAVVRECAQVAFDDWAEGTNESSSQIAILKHFGVKE